MAADRGRIASLDALRGAAALGVVLVHLSQTAPPLPPDQRSEISFTNLVRLFFSLGSSGVVLFFLISGFCVHWRWAVARRNETDNALLFLPFWKRRLRRLWPPYAIALALYLGVLTLLGRFHWNLRGFYDVGMHAFMLQNLDPRVTYSIFGAFWSLAVEAQMYLAYFLFLAMRAKWGWKATLLSGLGLRLGWGAFALAVPILWPGREVGWGTSMLYSWCLFMLGALSVEIYEGVVPCAPSWNKPAPAVVCLSISFAMSTLSRVTVLTPWLEKLDWQVNELFMAAGFFITLNWAAQREPHAGWSRFLASVGVFSYSLYLTHGLVLLMCGGAWKALGVHATTALVTGTLVGVPAALLAGRLFFQHFEKPLLRAREAGSGSARNFPMAIGGG